MEAHVVFTGQVADASMYYSVMDAVVSASAEEPFGIVIVEAMMAGCPVVALPRGGPAEIIENGVSGLLVIEDDLVNALAELRADPAAATQMGARGRERALTLFGAKAFADAFLRATVGSYKSDSLDAHERK